MADNLKLAAAAGALLKLAMEVVRFLVKQRSSETTHQATKAEMEMLVAAFKDVEGNPRYQRFLGKARQEKLLLQLVGRLVRSGESDRLMDYYDLGFSTLPEIGAAWEHRLLTPTGLSFRIPRLELLLVALLIAYMFACAAGCLYSARIALVAPAEAVWMFAGYAALFLLFGVFSVLQLRGYPTALLLWMRERRYHKQQETKKKKGESILLEAGGDGQTTGQLTAGAPEKGTAGEATPNV